MAITSTYYDTSAGVPASLVTEVDWAHSHPSVGASEYGVVTAADFKVTAHPSTPFGLNLAPGKAWGHGVFDESDAIITLTAVEPASTRWDLVAMRRDWTPASGGPSAPVLIQGGTVEAIPAGRNNNPGTLDDQPLFLVLWTHGQTTPTALVDIRCWAGNGGLFAKSTHVLDYLSRVGATVQLARGAAANSNATHCTFELGPNDVPGWVIRDNTSDYATISTFGSGWLPVNTPQGHVPRLRRDGNLVRLIGAVRRNAGSVLNILTIPPAFLPANSSTTTFIGGATTSSGLSYELALSNNLLTIPFGYASRSDTDPPNTVVFPVTSSWAIY